MANRLEPWERGWIPHCATIYIVSLAAVFVSSRNAPPRSHSIWADDSHGPILWNCFAPNNSFTCRPIIACMLTSLFEITSALVKLSKDSHFNSYDARAKQFNPPPPPLPNQKLKNKKTKTKTISSGCATGCAPDVSQLKNPFRGN